MDIQASFPGTGDNSNGTNVAFDPGQYEERAALLLLNGVIYTSWASHCDIRPYTGWIIGYSQSTLAQNSVLNITPNGNEGAIWMAGAGLAGDSSGNIYFLDANGAFDAILNASGFPGNGDYGNAFLKLSTSGNQLAVADYFEMTIRPRKTALIPISVPEELSFSPISPTAQATRCTWQSAPEKTQTSTL